MTAPSTRDLGSVGEKLATKFLQRKGYKIIDRNFRSRLGEIDIIALEDDTLVFIEVKIRSIVKTGQYYKLLHPEYPEALRIDVVTVDFFQKKGEMRLIKNITM